MRSLQTNVERSTTRDLLAAVALWLFVSVLLWGVLYGGARIAGTDAHLVKGLETQTRRAFAQGLMPWWNPYLFSGFPHQADIMAQVFYPLTAMLRLVPLDRAYGWLVAIHLWIAGLGTFALCRTIGVSRLPAVAAAVGFMFGGVFAPRLYFGHWLVVCGLAWLPAVFAATVRMARSPRVAPAPLVVWLLVLQFLAGYVQGSVYVISALVAYVLYCAAWPDPDSAAPVSSRRPVVQLALAGVLFVGLTAFQWAPLAGLMSQTGRLEGLSYGEAVDASWRPQHLVTLGFPFALANPSTGYRDAVTSDNLSEKSAYVGLVLACLAPLALFGSRRRRFAVFFAVVGAVALALSLAETLPLYRLHFLVFPAFRIPPRVLPLLALSLVVLGAMACDVLAGLRRGRRETRLAAFYLVALSAMLAAVVVWLWTPPAGSGLLRSLQAGLLGAPVWVTMAAAVSLLALGLGAGTFRPRAVGAIVAVVTLSELFVFARPLVNVGRDAPYALVAQWQDRLRDGRALSICESVVSGSDLLTLGIPTVDSFGSLFLADYARFATLVRERPSERADVYRRVGSLGEMPPRRDLLNLLGVTHVIACRPVGGDGLELLASDGLIWIYRNRDALPRAVATCRGEPATRSVLMARLAASRYDGNLALGPARVAINVRWSPAASAETRQERERRYGLRAPVALEERTFRYELGDTSSDAIKRLVTDPLVEDTSGIDRWRFALDAVQPAASDAPRDHLLIGETLCGAIRAARVVTADRPDGYLNAEVDAPQAGLVFLSEPYYPERRAWVDGREVAAVRANLAFTAVPVEAGRHVIELRYVPRRFYVGITVSILTLAVWLAAGRAGRARRAAG